MLLNMQIVNVNLFLGMNHLIHPYFLFWAIKNT
nr:MAG TPA: hypothetical protein [Caudoviricetes sp.]